MTTKPTRGGTGRRSGATDPLEAALSAARASPELDEAWDTLDRLAGDLQRSDEVAALYREVLGRDLPVGLATGLAQRAVRFIEEWYGESDPGLAEVLSRAIEVDASADWAFERLTVVLTVAERWTDLLALYDRALQVATAPARRAKLLQEAADLAKDFAGNVDRATAYLEELARLRPADAQVASALDRLLERQSRWADLVSHWRARLLVLGPEEVGALRGRIAACLLDRMDDPGTALGELRAGGVPDDVALPLLERILARDDATAAVRGLALALLRSRYEALGRGTDLLRVLNAGHGFAEHDDRLVLHREAGERLQTAGDEPGAMDHWASVLALDPSDLEAEARLARFAARTGRHEEHARALEVAGAAATEGRRRASLFATAAAIHADHLRDPKAAVELWTRACAEAEAPVVVLRESLRRLDEALDGLGRSEERQAVLERLANLEPRAIERRAALDRAASLAAELGALDRALGLWERALEAVPSDLAALTAIVEVLHGAGRKAELVEALRRRAQFAEPHQRRSDLTRAARLQAELGDPAAALATWLEVREGFGDDEDVVDALAELFSRQERWADLRALLEGVSERSVSRAVSRLVHAGDALRERLAEPDLALPFYRRAAEVDPTNAGARAGLAALVDVPTCKAGAVETLAHAYSATDDWRAALALAPERFAVAPDRRAGVHVLRETAALAETKAGDVAAATRALAQAMPLAPEDELLEAELLRLAGTAGLWEVARDAIAAAVAALPPGTMRGERLRFVEGRILERELGDAGGALGAYADVLAADPSRLDVAEAVMRAGARAKQWAVVARAVVATLAARGRVEDGLLASIEAAATEGSAWEELTWAMAEAIAESTRLPQVVARELETRVALWHRDRRGDADAAEGALLRALAHDPGHAPTLSLLAEVQRRSPTKALVETLLRLGEVTPGDLDPLVDAATVAREALRDGELAARALDRLLDAALLARRSGSAARGGTSVAVGIAFALEGLTELAGRAKDAARVADLLVERAGIASDPAEARRLLHQAAETCVDPLGDRFRALDLYRRILATTPDDGRAIAALERLYADLDLPRELVALHRHELGLRPASDRRITLRLEVARLLGEAERRGGRVETLLENLADSPGHDASIDAIAEVLGNSRRHAELVKVLVDQATRLDSSKDAGRAARLFTRAARLSEEALADLARAIECHEKSVALVPSVEGLEALARIHLGRTEPGRAAKWLERLLETGPAEARTATALRLAQATLDAGDTEGATSWLERAAAEDPAAAEVRDRLAERHRAASAFEKLAALLVAASPHVSDAATVLAYAREISELHRGARATAAEAAAVLGRARTLVPEDRWVQRTLAEMLRFAGRLDEARTVLEALLQSYGRRRSEERAGVHLELGRVLRAQGKVADALAQLDLASNMDARSVAILRTSAEIAREAGKIDKAERAYRALLLVVKQRGTADADAGAAEVLLELSRLALRNGESERAEELLASAVSAAAESEAESRRFRDAMLEQAEHEILERALRQRLERVEDPATRATVQADLALVLERASRPADALAALLDAVELAPDQTRFATEARALAARAGLIEKYVEKLGALVDRFRRKEDLRTAAGLLLRMGEVLEKDAGDLVRAAEAFGRAEAAGEMQQEALEAVARVAEARGDRESRIRALRRLDTPKALYQLAETLLGSPATMDEGLTALSAAVEREPDYELASRILAAHEGADLSRVLPLQEWLARRSGDPRMLLDFLERRASLPWAKASEAKEGVDLAQKLGDTEREERLMRRAVDIARESPAGVADASWALLPLARRRRDADDLAGAVALWEEAAGLPDLEGSADLGLELARAVEPALAVRVYERLLPADPTRREIWEPLARGCRELGDVAALDRIAAATLPMLVDGTERNLLRLELVRLLVTRGERIDEARDVLRDVLMEDPDHVEAYALLADLLERTGEEQDLAELLSRRFQTAREEGDAPTAASLALRLGAFHARTEPDEAKGVYRSGLEIAPNDPRLLLAVLRLSTAPDDPPDRTVLVERVLSVLSGEEGERAALELADQSAALGDRAGLKISLERGSRASGGSAALRARLEAFYRESGDDAGLVEMLVHEAEQTAEPVKTVALLTEAAAVRRDRLNDVAGSATLLRRAREVAPNDMSVVEGLARTLVAAGDSAAAALEVGRALDAGPAAPDRARLARMRAELRTAAEDDAGAVEDLETARSVLGAEVVPDLREALLRLRKRLAAKRDREGVRATTLRLVEVLAEAGEHASARDTLSAWIERMPEDRDALRLLVRLDEDAGASDGLVETLGKLVKVEEGVEQIEAVSRLADVARGLGRPADGRAGLEHVLLIQPEAAAVRSRLRAIYEEAGAKAELAELTLMDADHATDDETRYARFREAGTLLLEIEWPDRAIEALEEARRLKPEDPEALLSLVDAYTVGGRLTEAGDVVKKLLAREKKKKSPAAAALQLRMARVAQVAGDKAVQMDWLRQAFDTDKNNGDVAKELADLAESLGDDDTALKALQTITLMKGKPPMGLGVAYFRQARIAAKRGERQRALLWARRALVEDPELGEAKKLLKDLGEA